MTALDDYTSIGTLLFTIAQNTGEELALRVTTGFRYTIEAPRLSLGWEFPNAAECLAFLQAMNGDPAAQQEAIRQAKVDRLNRRIAEDTAEVQDLGG